MSKIAKAIRAFSNFFENSMVRTDHDNGTTISCRHCGWNEDIKPGKDARATWADLSHDPVNCPLFLMATNLTVFIAKHDTKK